MHEILTLQLGREANYLGTHFWNTQESYFTYSDLESSPIDHDIHFRAGIGNDGSDTYTPRVVIYDFKSNFGTLRRFNELYEALGEQNNAQAWGGRVVTQRQPVVSQSSYQQALNDEAEPAQLTTSNVRYWSDYAHTFYHPRSIVQIYETELNPGQRSFDSWASGLDLFHTLNSDEDLIDRDVRPFAEECDQMQGLQMFTGSENAWAGFAAEYLDRLRDEYGKLPLWIWGVGGPTDSSQQRRTMRIVNQARAVFALSPQASMYIPLAGASRSLPRYVDLVPDHLWHTTALQATGLESLTLPTRLKALQGGTNTVLDHLAMSLSEAEERQISRLSFVLNNIPDTTNQVNGNSTQSNANGRLQHATEPRQVDLFPEIAQSASERDHTFSEICCERVNEDFSGGETSDDVRVERDDEGDGAKRLNFSVPLGLPLLSSFPHIYDLHDAKSISVRASLRTSSTIGQWTKDLELACRAGVHLDEREELSNGLKTIGEAYSFGFSSDEDDDWDDE